MNALPLTTPLVFTVRGDDRLLPFTLAILPGERGAVLRVFPRPVHDPIARADEAVGEIHIIRSGIVVTAEVWTAEMIHVAHQVDGVLITLGRLFSS